MACSAAPLIGQAAPDKAFPWAGGTHSAKLAIAVNIAVHMAVLHGRPAHIDNSTRTPKNRNDSVSASAYLSRAILGAIGVSRVTFAGMLFSRLRRFPAPRELNRAAWARIKSISGDLHRSRGTLAALSPWP